MQIVLPELCLVLLIGASGSGKSSFARRHFRETEVLSSDFYRGVVADDENEQAASKEAFEVLHFIASKRLAAGRLTVIDATNVQAEARRPLLVLAKEHHVRAVAIVLNVPEALCHERNALRPNRQFGPHVVHNQMRALRSSLGKLSKEGVREAWILRSPEEIESVQISRAPLPSNFKYQSGPFDIFGDVHGCYDELCELLEKLDYQVTPGAFSATPPGGRKALFVGDLIDRGPNSPAVLKLVMNMVAEGNAFCAPGNHDARLVRKLRDGKGTETHGLKQTLEQLANESDEFKKQTVRFLESLPSHLVLEDGKLVIAHAGLPTKMHNRSGGRVRSFALYGDTTGEKDEYDMPVRLDWAKDYRGAANVAYGHTPVGRAQWLNNTINIDTGCVFGGSLSALRWPERELVQVKSHAVYAEPGRPFLVEETALSPQQQHDDILDLQDVTGKRLLETRLLKRMTIREENATAALEIMSRFAADPRWLIYLPPTMSPSETTRHEGLLEHPDEAFAYYRREGVAQVICEAKHMGSRAVVIICRDSEVARQRFGITTGEDGVIYTRTGRRFFNDANLERALLYRLRETLTREDFWDEFSSNWFCFDCELMPWSAKAQELLQNQYAAVGAAAQASLHSAVAALETTSLQGGEGGQDALRLLHAMRAKAERGAQFREAYRHYCWPVEGLEDLKLAPFHLLASEGAVHIDKNHRWHMETLARLASDELFIATPFHIVETNDERSCDKGVRWWDELTSHGGEGMVVKPLEFIAMGAKGLLQPAIKCRGREYLRIIYGPDYTAPENLERLRQRGLSAKRSLALREFALGVEALERFVKGAPLRQVHECVFAVLALESEPVDPRL
jgi:protein phosphatase